MQDGSILSRNTLELLLSETKKEVACGCVTASRRDLKFRLCIIRIDKIGSIVNSICVEVPSIRLE